MATSPPTACEARPLHCPCGIQYPWRPADAGLDLRCLCGRLLTIPASRPAQPLTLTEQPNDSDRRARAKRIACPVCCTPMPRDTPICIACGFNRQEGRRVYVQQDRPPTPLELQLAEEARLETRSRRIACLTLLAIALIVALILRPLVGHISFLHAALLFLPWALLSTAVMYLTLRVVSRWLDVQVDDIPTTALAVAAVAVNTFQWRALALEITNVSPPTGSLADIGLLAPLTICMILLPCLVINLLANYLFELELTTLIPLTMLLWIPETAVFTLFTLFVSVPW